VSESQLAAYSATYECFSEGTCSSNANNCSFLDAKANQSHLCLVRNNPKPVEVKVSPEWYFGVAEEATDESINVKLLCTGLLDGDGIWVDETMRWSWILQSDSPEVTASVVPVFDGSTKCETEVFTTYSSVESASTCDHPSPVLPMSGLTCVVSNTVFFEGIPTISRSGLFLFAFLMLITGAIAYRRI
jgi:hypothetical protein